MYSCCRDGRGGSRGQVRGALEVHTAGPACTNPGHPALHLVSALLLLFLSLVNVIS